MFTFVFPFCSAILNFVLVLTYYASACTRKQFQRSQTGFFLCKTKLKHKVQKPSLICSGHKWTFSPEDWMRTRVKRNCTPRANPVTGCIKRGVTSRLRQVIPPLYSILLSMGTAFTSSTVSNSGFPNIGRTWSKSRGVPQRWPEGWSTSLMKTGWESRDFSN